MLSVCSEIHAGFLTTSAEDLAISVGRFGLTLNEGNFFTLKAQSSLSKKLGSLILLHKFTSSIYLIHSAVFKLITRIPFLLFKFDFYFFIFKF